MSEILAKSTFLRYNVLIKTNEKRVSSISFAETLNYKNLFDLVFQLTDIELKQLKNSLAEKFSEEHGCVIKEQLWQFLLLN